MLVGQQISGKATVRAGLERLFPTVRHSDIVLCFIKSFKSKFERFFGWDSFATCPTMAIGSIVACILRIILRHEIGIALWAAEVGFAQASQRPFEGFECLPARAGAPAHRRHERRA